MPIDNFLISLRPVNLGWVNPCCIVFTIKKIGIKKENKKSMDTQIGTAFENSCMVIKLSSKIIMQK